MTIWIGVDPGSKFTGLVLRQGPDLIDHHTIERASDHLIDRSYIECVMAQIERWRLAYEPTRLAIEDLVAPKSYINGKLALNKPEVHFGTAAIIGAVLAVHFDAVLVPPGGNGSKPLFAYPEALRPTRGSGKGTDKLRHCRSAHDVVEAAQVYSRVRSGAI